MGESADEGRLELGLPAAHFIFVTEPTLSPSSSPRRASLAPAPRVRVAAIVAVALLHLAVAVALLRGFSVNVAVDAIRDAATAAYDVPLDPPSPPPPPPPPPTAAAAEPEGAAAPPAPRATPKAIVAPSPPVVIPRPAIKAPPVASTGSATRSGASDAGQGTGGGGSGAGTGAGGSGDGGGGRVVAQRSEKIAGEIRASDFPRSGVEQRDGKSIIVRYTVGVDGRVRGCRITQSSGNAEADAIVCRLIEQRFRYRPALDADGEPIEDMTGWKQWWWR